MFDKIQKLLQDVFRLGIPFVTLQERCLKSKQIFGNFMKIEFKWREVTSALESSSNDTFDSKMY